MKLGAVYERLNYETPAAGKTSRPAFSLAAKSSGIAANGKHTVGAVYTQAGDLSGTLDTGAQQISLRYGYYLSSTKQTELYFQYTHLKNDANGSYNFADGLMMSTSAGASLSGIGVGISHAL